jgi:serine/threonine-protein kinase SRK2
VCKGDSKDKSRAGTLPYMPPELHFGHNNYSDPALDIWAIGIMLYLMLYGVFPFDGRSEEDLKK